MFFKPCLSIECREHPEISEGLCIEMMTRQLAASLADVRFHSLQHHILTALTPWMENITFRVNWKGRFTTLDSHALGHNGCVLNTRIVL